MKPAPGPADGLPGAAPLRAVRRSTLRSLAAGFDDLALSAPAPALREVEEDLALRQPDTWQQLIDWCHHGAGPGHRPLLSPAAQPAVQDRIAVASLLCPDDMLAETWSQVLARTLDGARRLDELPGLVGLGWRVLVKAREACWWRPRGRDDPWDAGWARTAPASLQQLGRHFLPRRATLVLADRSHQHLLEPALTQLLLRCEAFDHPVRWLWVGQGGAAAGTLGNDGCCFHLR